MSLSLTKKQKDVEKVANKIINTSGDRQISLVCWLSSDGYVAHEHGDCHANLSRNVYSDGKVTVFGQKFTGAGRTTKPHQQFYEWLLDENESIYSDLIKYLRKTDDFHVVRDKKGLIHGFVVSTRKVNKHVLFNFFKQSRYTSEHPSFFEFWKKWALDKGKNPRVAYFMGPFYSPSGERKNGVGHGPIESRVRTCDFRKVLYGGGGQWKLDQSFLSDGHRGEQINTWGGEKPYLFDMHSDVPIITKDEVPTRFWTKYYGNGALKHKLTDESIENFLDNAESIYKDVIGMASAKDQGKAA